MVACRRIVERHPTSGPLWWLCSSVVAAPAPFEVAARLADRIEDDPTPEVLIDALAGGRHRHACSAGRTSPARRCSAAATPRCSPSTSATRASSFVRRLQRNDIEAEIVDPAGLGAAVLASDVVLIEALACTASRALAVQGSLAAASVAYAAEVPVWLVAGRGRCLPKPIFEVIVERAEAGADVPWRAEAEAMPLGLFSRRRARRRAASSATSPPIVLDAGVPARLELLRASPM